jgi:hypothetical protein
MTKTPDKDLLPEYDFSKGVRGKYAARVAKGSNVVVLDKDVQSLFPDSAAVNAALRALAQAVAVTRRVPRPKAAARKRAAA